MVGSTGSGRRCFFVTLQKLRTIPIITSGPFGLPLSVLTALGQRLLPPLQLTKECLAKIGIEEKGKGGQHGQDAIMKLIAAIMHLLNVGFKSGMGDRVLHFGPV